MRHIWFSLLVVLLAACGNQPEQIALPTQIIQPTSTPEQILETQIPAELQSTSTPQPTALPVRQTAPRTENPQYVVASLNGSVDAPDMLLGDLYIINWNGTNLRRLTVDPAPDYDAVWTTDTNRLIFVSEREGTPQLYVLNVENNNPIQRVAPFSAGDERDPTIAPTGLEMAFTSGRGGADAIYKMTLEGRGEQQLTINATADYQPDWSPDNSWIVHTSERDGNPEIYIMDTNGGQSMRLTNWSGVDNQPAFSPDGRRVAFISDRDGLPQVHVMTLPVPLLEYEQASLNSAIDITGVIVPLQLDLNASPAVIQVTQITGDPYPKESPSWVVGENGGFKLLYVAVREGLNGELRQFYLANDDGSNALAISPPNMSLGYPVARPPAPTR